MFWRWAKIQTWQLHTSKCIIFTNKQQLNIKHQMQWQGGVHNSVMPREKAVGESFRERVVEVALEQWPQQHTALYNTDFASMPSRHQRQFHVTGTQYISTDKVQSQTLNTGGTAETFSPWANKPRAFFTIFRIVGAALQRSQQNQRSAILPLYQPIHSSEIYLFGVHLQESCRS